MVYEALVVDYAGVFTEHPIAEVVRAVRARGLRTALLSNSDVIPRGLPDVFDAVVVSGFIGIGKPEPEVYRFVANKLRTVPEKCVFVDDVVTYVRGAAATGMTGVHHTSVDSTVEELEILLGFELRSVTCAPVRSTAPRRRWPR